MKTDVTPVVFSTEPITVRGQDLLRLPEAASKAMPSRGQVAVTGTMNGHEFRTVLEPDGYWGHFIKFDNTLQKTAGSTSDIRIEITPTKDWPEPVVPKDIADALVAAPQKVKEKWKDITPMARWEWIRWVNSTANTDTRAIRVEKTISKLNGKHRRPCCFNLAACTDPDLAKSGRLADVAPAV